MKKINFVEKADIPKCTYVISYITEYCLQCAGPALGLPAPWTNGNLTALLQLVMSAVLQNFCGLSSENPAVYGLSPVLSAVRVGEITVTVINNRNFSRSLKLVSLIICARCEMRRAISVCMQLCFMY